MKYVYCGLVASLFAAQISAASTGIAADFQREPGPGVTDSAGAPSLHRLSRRARVQGMPLEARGPIVPSACDAVVFPRHPLCSDRDWFSAQDARVFPSWPFSWRPF
jgi:hypothetical protein